MNPRFPWKWVILSSLVSVGLLAGALSISKDVFLSPDTIGLACGAEHLFTHHSFSSLRTPLSTYDYVPCWTAEVYPAVQLLVAVIRFTLPNIDWSIAVFHLLLAFLFPLSVGVLTWNLKRQRGLTVWASILAACLPVAQATLQLTPQAIVGTTILFFTLSLVSHSETPSRKWLWVIPCMIILYFTHTLTFFYATIFLGVIWMIHKPLKHSILFFMGSLVAGLIGSLVALGQTVPLTEVAQGIWQQMQIIDTFQQRPVWDHASVFGYVLIPLAVFGFASAVFSSKEKWILALWLAFPLFLSHLNFLGLSFLPHRMVWYLAPSLILSGAAGLVCVVDRSRSWFKALTAASVCAILFTHTLFITYNNIQTYHAPIHLTPAYMDVIQEVSQIPANKNILTIMTAQDRLNLHLPRLTQANVISFPSHQFKNPKDFTLAQPYWASVQATNPDDPLISLLYKIYVMVEQPQEATAQDLYATFKISRVIVRKNSSEGKALRKSNLFTEVYENETYVILQP